MRRSRKSSKNLLAKQGTDVRDCDDDNIKDLWFHYHFRQNFIISDEKREKLKQQNKRRVEFTLQLNTRTDITKDSRSHEVFEQLKREGVVSIPKKYALPLIQDIVLRKKRFHELELCFDLIKWLLNLVPCVQEKNYFATVTEYLHTCGLGVDLPEIIVDRAIFHCQDVICDLEVTGWFHPVIRKDRLVEYYRIVDRRCKIECRKMIKRWKGEIPLAFAQYIKEKEDEILSSKAYQDDLRAVELHQEFHKHVGSCNFIEHDMRVEDLLEDDRVVEPRFKSLDKSLLELTLKEWLTLVLIELEYTKFESWLKGLARDRVHKGLSSMDKVLAEIRTKHPNFPKLPDNWIFRDKENISDDWTNDLVQEELSLFNDLLGQVKRCTKCEV